MDLRRGNVSDFSYGDLSDFGMSPSADQYGLNNLPDDFYPGFHPGSFDGTAAGSADDNRRGKRDKNAELGGLAGFFFTESSIFSIWNILVLLSLISTYLFCILFNFLIIFNIFCVWNRWVRKIQHESTAACACLGCFSTKHSQ